MAGEASKQIININKVMGGLNIAENITVNNYGDSHPSNSRRSREEEADDDDKRPRPKSLTKTPGVQNNAGDSYNSRSNRDDDDDKDESPTLGMPDNNDAVVEDEEFDYATPPDVFLSYQWGHQDEVRLLRQHLEMAGYSCWMDVRQMGGGDKQFDKIDTGIRGAKVIICCVSTKYTKSPNCIKEVELSNSLDKPMIPLLMEKLDWPPSGSMGPIFSGLLYVRFFQQEGEETGKEDKRYWPLAKFQELLMQLKEKGSKPDSRRVQPEYKNWWLPKVEEVIVDKDRAKKQKSGPSDEEVQKKQ